MLERWSNFFSLRGDASASSGGESPVTWSELRVPKTPPNDEEGFIRRVDCLAVATSTKICCICGFEASCRFDLAYGGGAELLAAALEPEHEA